MNHGLVVVLGVLEVQYVTGPRTIPPYTTPSQGSPLIFLLGRIWLNSGSLNGETIEGSMGGLVGETMSKPYTLNPKPCTLNLNPQLELRIPG